MGDIFCFKINNPSKAKYNEEELKSFVEKLYKGTKEPKFTKEEKLPLHAFMSKQNNSVCIKLANRAKKNRTRVDAIHSSLKTISWKDGITLSKPEIFVVETKQWWVEEPLKKSQKWSSLSHRGPYFGYIMEPYVPIGGKLVYEGKTINLTPSEEKVASFYAKRLMSEQKGGVKDKYTQDKVFNANFWGDFTKYLTKEHRDMFKGFNPSKDFDKINWDDLIKKLTKTELTEEEKKKKQVKADERRAEYAYATMDGNMEKIANFMVEPATIFLGRGNNPKRGRIKRDVRPEDVTINIGARDKVPSPPPGHKWGGIAHDTKREWLAKWTDTLTKTIKYIWFGAEGQFKGKSDLAKYEKARKLEKNIETIRKQYMADALSSSLREKQLGTVLYIIDHHGVRVGNDNPDLIKEKIEKGSGDELVVGASTLRVRDVNLKPDNVVNFKFLGKDSIEFDKDIKVPSSIYNNFREFTKNKDPKAKIFNLIDSTAINNYLKTFDKDFSAKVFRTRLASEIMHNALQSIKVPPNSKNPEIKILFNKANAKVADVLNHTRNLTIKGAESLTKAELELKELRKQLKQAKKEGKSTKTLENRIEKKKASLTSRKELKNVAVTTSLNNYIDPRVVVSWSKAQEANLSAIYTAALLKKFKWADDSTDENWDWLDSPLVDGGKMNADKSKSKSGKQPTKKPSKGQDQEKPKNSKKPVKTKEPEPEDEVDTEEEPGDQVDTEEQEDEVDTEEQEDEVDTEVEEEPEPDTEVEEEPGDEVDTEIEEEPEPDTEVKEEPEPKPKVNRGSKKSSVSSKNKEENKSNVNNSKLTKEQENMYGTIEDYKMILDFCNNPKDNEKLVGLRNVSQPAMRWVYNQAKNSIAKGLGNEQAKNLVRLYEKVLLPTVYKKP